MSIPHEPGGGPQRGAEADDGRPTPPEPSTLPVDEGSGYADLERRIAITVRTINRVEFELAQMKGYFNPATMGEMKRGAMIAAVQGHLDALYAELAELRRQA